MTTPFSRRLPRLAALLCLAHAHTASACDSERVEVVVLGSGGPDFADGRAGSGYAVLLDGRARLIVDAGPGTAARFHQQGLAFEDVAALLITHLHVDHVADVVAYLKAAWFGPRTDALPVFGPPAGGRMPSIEAFIRGLIETPGHSPFGYLAGYLDGSDGFNFAVRAEVLDAPGEMEVSGLPEALAVRAVAVDHGPNPALAWRIEVAGCALAFSGDTAATGDALASLAQGANLLVAHHAVPETAGGAALALHMAPSRIGEVAAAAGVGRVLLSHRMQRTRGREAESLEAIRQSYRGPVEFAEEAMRVRP